MSSFIWPRITQATKDAVMTLLDKGEISYYDRAGIFVTFEDRWAAMTGRKHALVVSSGTAALHTAMVAAGFGHDDEVIFPAYTFFATVTPIFQTGAVPVLCDAGPDGNIDPAAMKRLITPRTKAVFITHMWGMPCDLDAILAICQQHNLQLIEDCAHAHGAIYKGRPVGSESDIAIWSNQGQKIITGGEGGILVTNNTDFYERALLFGHYNKRCKQEIRPDSLYYAYAETGFGLKLRAHPLAIAMANEQLDHLPQWHAAKNQNAAYLNQKLAAFPELELPFPVHDDDQPAWYAYTFRLRPETLNISTQEFCKQLQAAGLTDAATPDATRPLNLFKLFQDPTPLFPHYTGKVAYKPGDFPVAESLSARAIRLPVDVDAGKTTQHTFDKWAQIIGGVIAKNRAK